MVVATQCCGRYIARVECMSFVIATAGLLYCKYGYVDEV